MASLVAGCGGSVSDEPLAYFDDAGNIIETGTVDAARDTFVPDTRVDASRDTGRDAVFDTWIDPGCPDAPVPKPVFECDPLKPPPGDCPRGQGCYPYVDYPDDPCEHEIYRSTCIAAGTGKQGDPCSSSMCAAGFACVASGAGNVCVQMCSPSKPGGCPEGLVCHPTDVPSVGACL